MTTRQNVLMLKPEVAAKMSQRHEAIIEAATRYEPMVVKPTPLGYGMTDSYGFRTSNAPLNLVKTRNPALMQELRDNTRPEYARFMEGINTISGSRFRINTWMLNLLRVAVKGRKTIAKLPVFNPEKPQSDLTAEQQVRAATLLAGKTDDTKVEDYLKTLSDAEARLVRVYRNEQQDRREYIKRKTELAGARINLQRSIALAEKYSKFREIFFPVSVDTRGRVYYATPSLNPQGPDHEKALIELAHGERVGMKGLFWLAVNVSNLMGYDKADLGDRVRYVKAHWDQICEWVKNPLVNRGWEDATDKPLQFLVAAKDLIAAVALPNPYDHISHVSLACDASCSGLQILGALTRCETSLFNTNCLPAVRDANGKLVMQDIYRLAATEATKMLHAFAAGDDAETAALASMILNWGYAMKDGQLSRSILKRNTMTYFYGSKANGMGQQLMDDHFKPELKKAMEIVGRDGDVTTVGFPFSTREMRVAASQFLAKVNFAAIEVIAPLPSMVMKSLQRYGALIAKGGKKMRWTTPLGFIVEQHYEVQEEFVVDSTLTGQQRKQTVSKRSTGVVDENRQKLGAAPNYTHSNDSSVLLCGVSEGSRVGITDWRVVHDSFATSAAKTPRMLRVLKKTIHKMYSVDVLGKLAEELNAQVPDNLKDQIIPFPAYGDADLSLIRKAQLPFC